jgi:hypothetical protein
VSFPSIPEWPQYGGTISGVPSNRWEDPVPSRAYQFPDGRDGCIHFKHGDLFWMELFEHSEVAHNTGHMSKPVEYSVIIVRREFGLGCLTVGVPERSMKSVIPPGVLLLRMHIISKFELWRLSPITDMPLEMM